MTRGSSADGRSLPSSRGGTLRSSLARLANLVVDPPAAFRDVNAAPTWALAFLVAVALRFASLFAFYGPAVTPLKLIGGVLYQCALVAPPILLGALVLWLSANAWRLGLDWRPSVCIVTHAYVAYTLVTIAFASVAGALLPESAEIDLRSPPFTNLVSALGDVVSPTLRRVVAELDVRSAYALMVLWFALRGAAPGEPKPLTARVIATIAAVRIAAIACLSLIR